MANDENLTSWKPGQSGNPTGKIKGTRNFATIFNEILEAHSNQTDSEGIKLTNRQVMALKQVDKAKEGDLNSLKEIIDRTEGRAVQTSLIDQTNRYPDKININFVKAPDKTPDKKD